MTITRIMAVIVAVVVCLLIARCADAASAFPPSNEQYEVVGPFVKKSAVDLTDFPSAKNPKVAKELAKAQVVTAEKLGLAGRKVLVEFDHTFLWVILKKGAPMKVLADSPRGLHLAKCSNRVIVPAEEVAPAPEQAPAPVVKRAEPVPLALPRGLMVPPPDSTVVHYLPVTNEIDIPVTETHIRYRPVPQYVDREVPVTRYRDVPVPVDVPRYRPVYRERQVPVYVEQPRRVRHRVLPTEHYEVPQFRFRWMECRSSRPCHRPHCDGCQRQRPSQECRRERPCHRPTCGRCQSHQSSGRFR